jgi:hypothetical protein
MTSAEIRKLKDEIMPDAAIGANCEPNVFGAFMAAETAYQIAKLNEQLEQLMNAVVTGGRVDVTSFPPTD